MFRTNEIRKTFLDFFKREGHEIVSSSSLVPNNDPTLLFTNSGMVQFKNMFTGLEKRPYVRASTAQKCLRAGGKHNDLENVGYTARHHTFFEMLGNFSFGDYFKERAIELAWRLITQEFGISKEKLLVTVYADDEEAFKLWQKIAGLSPSKIIKIATQDNFWSMGELGPCGPCTEIFYDHGAGIAGGPPGSPNADGDRFIEIWNLVFMQFEQVSKDKRVNLPKPSIDTGMGLERLTALLQGKHDNYDIDTMQALIAASVEFSNQPAIGEAKFSHRVIADHLRACSFLIAEGVLPANEGRGYVLRRIMRRAMRHAHKLNPKDPFFWKLVPSLINEMGQSYPELGRAGDLVIQTLRVEEDRFRQTLEKGLKLLDEETKKIKNKELSGAVAFKLYDTYGFPLDLTQDILRGQGVKIETAGFNKAMEEQRQAARKAWSGSGQEKTAQIWFDLHQQLGSTEFLGYATDKAEARVLAILKQGQLIDEAKAGDEIAVIANQTPFYGESGGQMGDQGHLVSENNCRMDITDTLKPLGLLVVHYGKIKGGQLKVQDYVTLEIDQKRRKCLRSSHSATHLLHAALRRFLGTQVTQKGSLVAPDRLRFDFSFNRALTPQEIDTIEGDINEKIRQNLSVETRQMTMKQAVEAGAMALFGEKYGDEVRVVSMDQANQPQISVELCGGTHVQRTGDIGFFKIISETAVAAGIRRIESLVGQQAELFVREQLKLLQQVSQTLNTKASELPERIVELLDNRKKLEIQLSQARRQTGTNASTDSTMEVKGIKILTKILQEVPAKELKGIADSLRASLSSGIIVVISEESNTTSLVVAVTNDLIQKIDAVKLVKVGAEILGGKGGGGRPDMAQAGGPEKGKTTYILQAIQQAI
ncbi:MAG: alanine--tRNA ligase [Rhodospirillaceae bacterium]|nr:alanine--tRNA ligase [Rhodospirillaceae bacterium]